MPPLPHEEPAPKRRIRPTIVPRRAPAPQFRQDTLRPGPVPQKKTKKRLQPVLVRQKKRVQPVRVDPQPPAPVFQPPNQLVVYPTDVPTFTPADFPNLPNADNIVNVLNDIVNREKRRSGDTESRSSRDVYDIQEMYDELKQTKVAELREIAAALGIDAKGMKKKDLIDAIIAEETKSMSTGAVSQRSSPSMPPLEPASPRDRYIKRRTGVVTDIDFVNELRREEKRKKKDDDLLSLFSDIDVSDMSQASKDILINTLRLRGGEQPMDIDIDPTLPSMRTNVSPVKGATRIKPGKIPRQPRQKLRREVKLMSDPSRTSRGTRIIYEDEPERPLRPFSSAPEEVRRVNRATKGTTRIKPGKIPRQPRRQIPREVKLMSEPDRYTNITRLEEELIDLQNQTKPSAKRIREIEEEIADLEMREKKRADVRESTELSTEASSSGFTLNVSLHSLISDTSANIKDIEEEVRKASDEVRVSDITMNSLRSQISKASTAVDSLASRVSTVIEPSLSRVEQFVRKRGRVEIRRLRNRMETKKRIVEDEADEIENLFNTSRSSLDEIEIELDEIADRQKTLEDGMKRAMETKRGAAQKRGRAELRKNKEQETKKRLVAVADGIEEIVNIIDQAADIMQNVEDDVAPELTPVDMAYEAIYGIVTDTDMELKEKDAALAAAIDGLSDREIVALRGRLRKAGLMQNLTIQKRKGKYFIRGNGIK